MAINFQKIWTGLKIKAKAVLTSDSQGEMEVDSSSGKLNYHNGTSRSPVVTESHASVLTNKTIDANGAGNSISNLETADLAAGVLNTSPTLIGASDIQIPSALAVKTYVDNGLALQNEASEITVSPAVNGNTDVQAVLEDHETRIDTNTADIAAHIADAVDAHDASAISNVPSGNLAATDVQSALNELQTHIDTVETSSAGVQANLDAHINDTTDAHDASAISSIPSGNLAATDVQSALNELQSDIDTRATTTALNDHITDAVDAHDASAISSVPSGNLAATDVQSALNELQSDIDTRATTTALNDHITDTTDAHDASAISSVPAGNLAATDVQAALNELDTEKAKINGDLANSFSVLRSEIATVTDAATTGSNASLAAFTQGIIRLTNASLVSLANIPAGNSGQQLEIVNRTGNSVSIVDSASAVGTAANRILTGTSANITLASDASLLLEYDATSARWQIIGGSGGGSGVATSAIDNVFNINDATDATKQINFDAGGTTSTKTTIAAAQTANRTVTLPDATTTLVGTDVTQTLTNKTIVASNNTITTAASGNLTSTELNAALAELQADIDTKAIAPELMMSQIFDFASLADFTQTGLSLSTSNPIKGTKSALLTHQPATSQSFKQVIAVDRKYRGYNNTLSLSVRSSAASANLTILVTDETNAATLLSSSQITTGQITSAVFNTTNTSNSVTVTDNSILNQMKIGATITGSGIPANTIITNVGASTITISNAATATASGVALKVSVLPATKSFSFNIPSNCSSISYTVTALQEAGSPESYIDDVQIKLSSQAQTSASVTTTTFNATDWLPYTPTFQGFGTPTGVQFEYRQVGSNYEIRGKFVTGTTTTDEARISLPASATSANTSVIPSITMVGSGNRSAAFGGPFVLIAPSVTYLNFSNSAATGTITALPGNGVLGNGEACSFFASVPISGLTASTTTSTTIPLTSSVLVTQPDSMIRLNTGNGYGSTYTKVRRFANVTETIGSAITYTDSATLGGSFTINEEGEYTITYIDNGGGPGEQIGISLNAQNTLVGTPTAHIGNVTIAERLASVACDASGRATPAMWTGKLRVGDVIRAHNDTSVSTNSIGNLFTISKSGQVKQINPSSDQKVTIPTHELRFEDASARGSTDTGIVRFTTQALTRGDGFEVVSNATNGTKITIKKDGILSISTSLFFTAATSEFNITKNQTTLTTLGTSAETIASAYTSGNSDILSAAATVSVKVGDIIRVAANNTPASENSNVLTLVLQEQSVAVALQNVTPTYDNSDSEIRLNTANGYGSTNTMIRRFSNVLNNLGSDITYTDSTTLGASFTINRDGIYSIAYSDQFGSSANFGLSKNSAQLTTSIAAITASDRLTISTTSAANLASEIGWTGYLVKGDVIRAHTDSTTTGSDATRATFTISRVGKTSGTVDVTPFVQIPQQDVEQISHSATAATLLDTTGEWRFTVSNISTTNLGIIRIEDDTTNTRTKFVALKDCVVDANFTASQTTIANGINIYKNGVVYQQSNNNYAANTSCFVATSVKLIAGDYLTFGGGTPTSGDAVRLSISAEAQSSSVASSTQQVSSDTMSFVFKSTAIDPNTDPVGTFNTYTYAAGTNTATIATTPPTQTTSSMNINGIQVFARAYGSAGASTLPSRFDIFIGKGLKSKQVDAYANLGLNNPIVYDNSVYNTTTSAYFTDVAYESSTGILTLSAGVNNSSITTRGVGATPAGSGIANAYFVFNASKAPSLVTVPNLVQRIATLSDVKANTTAAGTNTAGVFNTRTLNTIDDPTGIVTSLASNQFTIPAGTYFIDAVAPAYNINRNKLRLRNITDSTTTLAGQSDYFSNSSGGEATLRGYVTLTSAKTFELQHYTEVSIASIGLGVQTNSGESEVYAQVKITKIK